MYDVTAEFVLDVSLSFCHHFFVHIFLTGLEIFVETLQMVS